MAPVNSIVNMMTTSGVCVCVSIISIGASCDELEVSYCRGYCLGTSEFLVMIHHECDLCVFCGKTNDGSKDEHVCCLVLKDAKGYECCVVLYPFHKVDGVISYLIM